MFPSVDGRLAILAVLPASFVVITVFKRFTRNRQNKLPPGPVPLPLLGNILSLDAKAPWLTYTEWAAVYGDLLFVQLLGQEIMVINSQHVAETLLDKCSRIYCDRPDLATLKPFGWSIVFAFVGYGNRWRLCRRLFHQTFCSDSALKFRPMQIKQAQEMILNLIDDPQNYHSHFATFLSSVAMSATYSYQTSPRHDPLVRNVENAIALVFQVMTPERAILLKTFPFLLKLPDWCWGSSIKRDARTSSNCMREMTDMLFQYAQDHMVENSVLGRVSMVAENLQRIEKQDQSSQPLFESALKKAATTAIIVLMAFALAMVSYPNVQKCAQAEIDSVVGQDWLPTFEDRVSLPYVESILWETLRWQPVLPLYDIIVPHATSSDDIYDGYFIPKGAIVLYNLWSIHSLQRYSNAFVFMPERFMDANGALMDDNPAEYMFGFGRHRCPGRYAGDASVWSTIITMLATVEFSSAKDDQGKVIEFTPQFTTGLTQYLFFLVSFRPITVTITLLPYSTSFASHVSAIMPYIFLSGLTFLSWSYFHIRLLYYYLTVALVRAHIVSYLSTCTLLRNVTSILLGFVQNFLRLRPPILSCQNRSLS
ncbi:cytochrome P450 [Suillus fuscotomentosus]|uniref:Cytochrome P450 n=1 Tax=Suillus fuscotomentosus TaxID=1912939 RepID=A0AAD4HII6_9AGAM|nr:cytochrome P450 [Suillus fuscotomentosus]KAG1897431.1 cytochrome P450 [Suillus fuscotomentosus]